MDQCVADVKNTGSFKITKNLSGKFQPGKSPIAYNMRGTITVMVWAVFGFGSVNSYRTSDSRQYRWRRQIDFFLNIEENFSSFGMTCSSSLCSLVVRAFMMKPLAVTIAVSYYPSAPK